MEIEQKFRVGLVARLEVEGDFVCFPVVVETAAAYRWAEQHLASVNSASGRVATGTGFPSTDLPE